jgi:arylsulfatase A-like enzyme
LIEHAMSNCQMKLFFTIHLAILLNCVVDNSCAAIDHPNIILIVADDLGYAHLGCYGQKKIHTPHLDRLAAEGMRFTDVYAGSCVCAPSRSVLMTGLHGGHTPVRGNSGGIPLAPQDVTVAEVLKPTGYSTGLFGKWGLGEHGTTGVPYKQGFDQFFGYLHQIHAHFHYPEYLWQHDRKFPLSGNRDNGRQQYAHDEIINQSLDFIRRHQKSRFFLYLPFALPHYELLVPENSLSAYAGKYPETPYNGRGGKTGYPHDYATQAMPRAATAAMISHMDRGVGSILALLRELEIDDQTIVLFTSDNGASSGPSDPDFFQASGDLRGTKGSLYEGGIRTPMIVRWPRHVAAGTVNRHVWYFADVLPTLAELSGATPPDGIDGISVVPTLLGERVVGREQPTHEYLYWEDDDARAVRRGRWKAIYSTGADPPVSLYDLQSDPGEAVEVSGKHPQIVSELKKILDDAHSAPRSQLEPDRHEGQQFR